MHSRFSFYLIICVALVFSVTATVPAQSGAQSELAPLQRMDVMRSKLDGMRRALNGALSAMGTPTASEKKNPDDPGERLRGLEKEVSSLNSELNDLRAKQERAERYDPTALDRLESSVAELNTRVESALQSTASARTTVASSNTAPKKKKKKGRLFGLLGGGDDDKYEELVSSVAPGRDRVLFEEAAKEVRKGNHETGRLLFSTIINTYPDSAFLPLAKLAIADSFYLEGTTSSLVQAAQAYLDWLTFFPTDPLADDAMLKVAEAEMRQMGLSDRDISHARKAEQRLKALLQQYPKSSLRPVVEDRLHEVQENLAMHNLAIARFYGNKFVQQKGGLKGAQSRLKEIVDKYPCFSYNDEVLFRLASTYQAEEKPDEAAKYYQQLIQGYPDSEFNEKARDQLNIIGAPIPEKGTPNTCSKKQSQSFMGNLMQQVSGKADVTTDKDGVLISKDGKEGTDLIDEALKYNGQLPEKLTPDAPTQRSATRPQPVTSTPPKTTSGNSVVPGSTPTPSPAVIKP